MTREGGSILHLLSDYQMDKGSLLSLYKSEYFKKKHSVPLSRIVWRALVAIINKKVFINTYFVGICLEDLKIICTFAFRKCNTIPHD